MAKAPKRVARPRPKASRPEDSGFDEPHSGGAPTGEPSREIKPDESQPAPPRPRKPRRRKAASSGKRPVGRRRKKSLLRQRIDVWRSRADRFRRIWIAVPPAVRTVTILSLALICLAIVNLGYQIWRKPAEMFFPVAGVLKKTPAETWREYGPLFKEYSTATIPPELLAALAQMESAGNPVAHTYWRWRLSSDLFSIYRPASSSVGMYQMTDPTFTEARRYCIRRHQVVEAGAWDDWSGCWFNGLYTRVIPAHAIQMTSAHLDRGVHALIQNNGGSAPGPKQKQDVAALIHLCGAGPARAYVQHGYRLGADESCGDHSAAAYIAQVDGFRRQFERLAAAER